jgi:hypothetical protein
VLESRPEDPEDAGAPVVWPAAAGVVGDEVVDIIGMISVAEERSATDLVNR